MFWSNPDSETSNLLPLREKNKDESQHLSLSLHLKSVTAFNYSDKQEVSNNSRHQEQCAQNAVFLFREIFIIRKLPYFYPIAPTLTEEIVYVLRAHSAEVVKVAQQCGSSESVKDLAHKQNQRSRVDSVLDLNFFKGKNLLLFKGWGVGSEFYHIPLSVMQFEDQEGHFFLKSDLINRKLGTSKHSFLSYIVIH